jgi:hypothetical protein
VKGDVGYEIWSKNLNERDRLEDLGVAGGIILRWVLQKQSGSEINSVGSGQGSTLL